MRSGRHPLAVSASLMAALSSCSDSNRFVELPIPLAGERSAIMVVTSDAGIEATAYDLAEGNPMVETTVDHRAQLFLFFYDRVVAPPGPLSIAAADACRDFSVAGHTRAYRASVANDDGFEVIADTPARIASMRFSAECPCVRFTATEVPTSDPFVWNVLALDDDRVLIVSPAGAEEISASSATATLVVASSELRSAHVMSDGRRFFGDSSGRLLQLNDLGELDVVATSSDTTRVRYMTGSRDEPLEIITMSGSGFVRVWDGTSWDVILDDSRVGDSNNLGGLALIDRGRALIVQGSGSGIHVWDASRPSPIRFVAWDIVRAGSINKFGWYPPFGGLLATRAGAVYASADGEDWSYVAPDAPVPISSVGGFATYGDAIIEARDFGGIQMIASDGKYCPFQEFNTNHDVEGLFTMGERLIVVGRVPEGAAPVAYVLTPVRD